MTAAACALDVTVTEPGVVLGMSEADYHGDPVPEGSLSSSGARQLLPPSCPALFRWALDNPAPPKRTFDFGHAAHRHVLGTGPELVAVDAPDWRTNAAKAARDEARLRGAVPLLAHEMTVVEDMAAVLSAHPVAGAFLHPDRGEAEVSMFWRDEPTKVMRRARLDWLPTASTGRRIIADYKTAPTAEPAAFARSAAAYGYHCQAAWYLDGVLALGLADDAAFVFIVQAKEPPYLVSVVELDALALRIGRERNRRAIDRYLQCRTTDRWPGFCDDVELVSLPVWAEREYEQETS